MAITQVANARRGRLRHPAAKLVAFAFTFVVGVGVLNAAWIVSGLPPQLHHGVIQPLPELATGILIVCLALGVSWLALRAFERRTLGSIGLSVGGRWPRAVAIGLCFGAVTPAAVLAVLLLLRSAVSTIEPVSLRSVAISTLPALLATLLVSSWEEIAMRGYPLQLLSELGGPTIAAAVSGIVFGLLHAANPGANPLGLAFTAVNGALLASIVLQTGSLWFACAYHAGWNVTAAILLGMADSGTRTGGALVHTTLSGPAWMTGSAYGFEASLLTGGVEFSLLIWLALHAVRVVGKTDAQQYFTPHKSASGA